MAGQIKKGRDKSGQYEIYMTALRDRFMTLDKAREITGKDKTASMALWRLSQHENLVRVHGGLYAAIPPERTLAEYEIDRFILADRSIKGSGAIAFHSALELHGAAYSRFTIVYFLTTHQVRPFTFQDTTYRPVLIADVFGTTTHYIDDVPVRVTDRERTFLDCIRRPDLCGGVEEYMKSFEAFILLDPDKLLSYLERYNERSLYQRAGLILESMKGRIEVPERLLTALHDEVSKNIYYLIPGKKGGGTLVKGWNVMVPRNMAEMMRSV